MYTSMTMDVVLMRAQIQLELYLFIYLIYIFEVKVIASVTIYAPPKFLNGNCT